LIGVGVGLGDGDTDGVGVCVAVWFCARLAAVARAMMQRATPSEANT
jgi:hypothetical protein